MSYNWNWSIFFEPAPGGTGTYFDMLLRGLWLTIQTGVCAWIIALAFGSVIGVLRTLPSKTAYWIGFAYVEFFRNMPLLVQLFLWFFVLPELLPRSWGLWLKQIPDAPFYTAAIGIGLFMSARVAVQLAAGGCGGGPWSPTTSTNKHRSCPLPNAARKPRNRATSSPIGDDHPKPAGAPLPWRGPGWPRARRQRAAAGRVRPVGCRRPRGLLPARGRRRRHCLRLLRG